MSERVIDAASEIARVRSGPRTLLFPPIPVPLPIPWMALPAPPVRPRLASLGSAGRTTHEGVSADFGPSAAVNPSDAGARAGVRQSPEASAFAAPTARGARLVAAREWGSVRAQYPPSGTS